MTEQGSHVGDQEVTPLEIFPELKNVLEIQPSQKFFITQILTVDQQHKRYYD